MLTDTAVSVCTETMCKISLTTMNSSFKFTNNLYPPSSSSVYAMNTAEPSSPTNTGSSPSAVVNVNFVLESPYLFNSTLAIDDR